MCQCSSSFVLSSFDKTSKLLDVWLKYPPSFFNQICVLGSPILLGSFLFRVDVREGSDGSGCRCSSDDVAAKSSS